MTLKKLKQMLKPNVDPETRRWYRCPIFECSARPPHHDDRLVISTLAISPGQILSLNWNIF